ncbi:MAG: PadR family transcriptional regulator [Actinobacteria bacterium HGW-Actinobacteria-7]|jgi:DNA-binding PadR family transcriptional regulator|nr:MAG: PadR family transcriptional regulator [Actinobacteria bacterium HGW-Actinobacteria-7]
MHNHQHSDEACAHGARHHHGGFGRHGFKGPFGMGGPHGFGGPGGMRARRGDVRTAVLRLLAEAPMHGYQIIQELSARSDGAWTPSPGSVYPTLQLLADEGLVVAEEAAGKKVFSLTETGAAEVAKTADQPAPWEEAAQSDSGAAGYREAAGKLMHAVVQIGKGGSAEQVAAAIEVLTDARKKLYAILAED